jgi:hypothetical protein
VNLVIIVLVVILAAVLGGGDESYDIGYTGATEQAVVVSAARAAPAVDVEIESQEVAAADVRAALDDGSVDAVVSGGRVESTDEPPDDLVTLLQAANGEVRAADALRQAGVSGEEVQRALSPPPLEIAITEPVDENADAVTASRSSSSSSSTASCSPTATGWPPGWWRRRPCAWSRSSSRRSAPPICWPAR